MDDIFRAIQRLAPPDYDAGYQAPDTLDNQQIPFLDTTLGVPVGRDHGGRTTAWAKKGDTGPAMRGRPNDFDFRVQSRMELQAPRETVVPMPVADQAIITVDPNQSGFWEIDAAGSFSLSFVPADPFSNPDTSVETPYFALWLVVVVNRQAGSVVTWPADIFWPGVTDADEFSVPPTSARTDLHVLVQVPNGGNPQWLGHVISQGYALAANLTSSTAVSTGATGS